MKPRWLTSLTVAPLIATLLTATPAEAAPAPTTSSAASSTVSSAAGTRITLVTGDVVSYSARGGDDDVVLITEERPGIRYDVYNRADGWYVLPSDAVDAVRTGQVDEGLFNVTYLAANGFGDNARNTLPVLLDQPTTKAAPDLAAAEALPASTPTRTLPSIGAVALDVDKSAATQLWTSLADQRRQRGAKTGALLLDRVYRVNLAQSVAQINAPAAWSAGFDGAGVRVGVLDTGYDATHPDLAGKVVDERSFVPAEPDLVDRNGHGTHVASTVAGTGAAADGTEKGAAPGAQLVVGKVLDQAGKGQVSQIIAGMEWAAGRSKIVSMSLGGTAPASADPMADAVASLTASTGALFVVAAGNAGPTPFTVASPGVAAAALTVGAVDSADKLAGFSSRGPAGDAGVKPEVVAPGVDIVAARAAQGTIGTPVNQHYAKLSGTSMATPHVAGTAAILAQRHPDWSAEQLKAGVIASTKDLGRPVIDQGAGRIDAAAAIAQGVLASPSTISFGELPAQTGTKEATLTYRNTGSAAVTLNLATRLSNVAGETIDGTLTTNPANVTVPAGGQAEVKVVLQPGKAPIGSYQGLVTAASADGTTTVSTPVGFANGDANVPVTFGVLDFTGAPAGFDVDVTVIPLDRTAGPKTYEVYNGNSVRLPPGDYFMAAKYYGPLPEKVMAVAFVIQQEVRVTEAAEVTFDLSSTKPVRLRTDEPGSLDATAAGYRRTTATGQSWMSVTGVGVHEEIVHVNPATAPRTGEFDFYYQTNVTRSPLDVRVDDLTVQAEYFARHGGVDPVTPRPLKMFEGKHRLDLVYLTDGAPAAFAEAGDLRGKLVLIQGVSTVDRSGVVQRAHHAGAAGVLLFERDRATTPSFANGDLLPVAYVSHPDGLRLLEELNNGRARANLNGTPVSSYAYHLEYKTSGQIPNGLTYDVRSKDMARIDSTYHAPASTVYATGFTVDGRPPLAFVSRFLAPSTRTEYYGPVTGDEKWRRYVTAPVDGRLEPMAAKEITLTKGKRSTDRWMATPTRYGQGKQQALFTSPYLVSRTAGAVTVYPQLIDSADHVSMLWPNNAPLDVALSKDGAPLTGTNHLGVRSFAVPAGEGRYRLDLNYRPAGDYRANTSWEFTSRAPGAAPNSPDFACWGPTAPVAANVPCDGLPTIGVDYDLPVTATNTARAPGVGKIRVRPHHVGGVTTKITKTQVSISYNAGKTWQPMLTLPDSQGWQTGLALHLVPGTTVSLRVSATDADGNKITQTLLNAYKLTK